MLDTVLLPALDLKIWETMMTDAIALTISNALPLTARAMNASLTASTLMERSREI